MTPVLPIVNTQTLLINVRKLIDNSRGQLASTVNSALTLLYWQIGQRIRNEVLQGERAEYGEQIVLTLSRQLEADFSSKNLRHMLRFAEVFPNEEIVYAVRRQLSWTHLRSLSISISQQTELVSQLDVDVLACRTVDKTTLLFALEFLPLCLPT